MQPIEYFMDSDKEALRLDMKTRSAAVRKQARWAGVGPGMRVADFGSGSGKSTAVLGELVAPDGEVLGIDISSSRVCYAKDKYSSPNVDFAEGDIRCPLAAFGTFDLIWMRFVLEYFQTQAFSIVQNVYENLKPGGTICLIDLDYNCMSHFGLSEQLDRTLQQVLSQLQVKVDFDPFMGRKLYAFLYDLGCEDIVVKMKAHHLIYGDLAEPDRFNWTAKVKAAKPLFPTEESYAEFEREFLLFFTDPRRFTYTPLIMVKGRKPL